MANWAWAAGWSYSLPFISTSRTPSRSCGRGSFQGTGLRAGPSLEPSTGRKPRRLNVRGSVRSRGTGGVEAGGRRETLGEAVGGSYAGAEPLLGTALAGAVPSPEASRYP